MACEGINHLSVWFNRQAFHLWTFYKQTNNWIESDTHNNAGGSDTHKKEKSCVCVCWRREREAILLPSLCMEKLTESLKDASICK